MIKFFILAFLMVILYCLGSGVYFLIRAKPGHSEKLARALTWRIGLSLALFGLLFLGYWIGLLHPHALLPAPSGQ